MSELKQEIIITGVNGFVGEHLAHYLHDSNYEVTGVGREPSPTDTVAPYLNHYQSADLMVEDQVNKLGLKMRKQSSTLLVLHLLQIHSTSQSYINRVMPL